MKTTVFWKNQTESEIKTYICTIILKGCLALSNQTERQAEIKPVGELKVISWMLYGFYTCNLQPTTYNTPYT
jgi:hypothetical protein